MPAMRTAARQSSALRKTFMEGAGMAGFDPGWKVDLMPEARAGAADAGRFGRFWSVSHFVESSPCPKALKPLQTGQGPFCRSRKVSPAGPPLASYVKLMSRPSSVPGQVIHADGFCSGAAGCRSKAGDIKRRDRTALRASVKVGPTTEWRCNQTGRRNSGC